ncbi:MAG: FtsX-like permease family protein [Acidobacteria bacterium]|nr:FtsX-like permease family protein [Acidobacteriota bacterium]
MQILTGLAYDVRGALRAFRADLGFFLFAAMIIGIGVGANTAVFSVMSPLLLRPLPFHEPEQLVWIPLQAQGSMSQVTSRTSNLRDFRDLNQTLDGLTGYFAFFDYSSYNLTGQGEPERLVGVGVATDFLEVLGVSPQLGRNFVDEEAGSLTAGAGDGRAAAILTHGFWTRRFAADPEVVGRVISLNEIPTEVVGILPPDFDFASTFTPASRVDFLEPFPIDDNTDNWGNTMAMVGRRKPGATIERVQADLDRMVNQLQNDQPDRWGLSAHVVELQQQISGNFRAALLVLAAAAGAVMLIACANLSNLLLARSSARHKELSIRSVLGASRLRLTRQLVTESMLVSGVGAMIGIGIAVTVTRAVSRTTSFAIPLLSSVRVDGLALLFTVAIALVVGLLLGIVPAFQIRPGREHGAINDATRGSSESKARARVREALVVAEVALACVLLVGGGLLLRSFISVLDVDLGFQAENAYAWRADPARSFPDTVSRIAFYEEALAAVAAVPGVDAVGMTDSLPLGRNRNWGIRGVGVTYDENASIGALPRMVDHRYIRTMGIPLAGGRYFNRDDTADTEQVVILNRAAAEIVFAGEDALNRAVNIGPGEWRVVGVVENVRHSSVEREGGSEMYLLASQIGDFGSIDIVLRSAQPLAALAPRVSNALNQIDPEMPTSDFQALDAVVDRAISPRRFILMLLGAFAGTALLLASLGVYAVLSYSVSQRTGEIGIRMALGESAQQVQRRVVARTMLLAFLGIAIGSAGSFFVARLIASMLFGVGSADPVTFVGMALVLLAVAAAAGYLPARRASRVDPMQALHAS